MSDRQKHRKEATVSGPVARSVSRKRAGGETDTLNTGKTCWSELKAEAGQTFDRWMAVGEALLIGRALVLRQAKTNSVKSQKYRDQYARWLAANDFADIPDSTRSKLVWMADNAEALRRWRDKFTDGERARMNAPSTVMRIAACKTRGLVAMGIVELTEAERQLEDDKAKAADQRSNAKRTKRGKQDNPGQKGGNYIVLVEKCLGIAFSVKSCPGQVTPSLIQACQDAADEWERTARHLEERRDKQRAESKRRAAQRAA